MSETNITGRDGYIIEKALFHAAHFIDGLPALYRERNDRDDMVRILRARLGDDFIIAAEQQHGPALEEMTGRKFNVEDYLQHRAGSATRKGRHERGLAIPARA